ncbi:MAG: arginine--tRNA ligase [Myxococcales bacterium]
MKDKAQQVIAATLARCVEKGLLPAFTGEVGVEAPKDPKHGDWSSNVAMLLGKAAKKQPRQVAQILLDNLVDEQKLVTKAEIAGPGFINLWISPRVWLAGLGEVLEKGAAYGRSSAGGGRKVMVEYVSANPTGPMHVGHGRGAVVGDAIATLLKATGYDVVREYYINDAGGQVKQLGKALYVRYREQCGIPVPKPELPVPPADPQTPEEKKARRDWDDAMAKILPYPGEYLIDAAKKFKEKHGEAHKEASQAEIEGLFTDFAMAEMLLVIKDDLKAINIEFDSWFSERTLHANKAIDKAVEALTAKGHMFRGVLPPPKDAAHAEDYEPREQLLFKATAFGDDQDRPLQKSDGAYTYFAADIAYHKDKLDRGHDWLIDVWGADHGGYVKRVKSAVEALSGKKGSLDVVLVQMVNLVKDGKPYKMSKRAGTFVTLRDVVDEAGRDATRVMFLIKRADSQLTFDLDLVKKQTMDNPVFYVQYGHARCANIFKKAAESGFAVPAFDLDLAEKKLTQPEELDLVRRILSFPAMVVEAGKALEPHRVFFWVQETSAAFQSWYTKGNQDKSLRVVIPADPESTKARLMLVGALKMVFANALALMGVSAPEWMEVPKELEQEQEGTR